MKLNPAFFKTIYADLLNSKKTRKNVQAALDAIDGYLAERAATLFGPVIDHLREVGEARSCTEIEAHFKRNFDVSGVTTACEYLADQGLIGKASTPVQLTRKSNVEVQELAFFYLEGDRMASRSTAKRNSSKAAARTTIAVQARAYTTSRTYRWRSRATSSSWSPGSRDRASRAWRSTPSTPRGSGATWNRCPATPSGSSPRWPSPTWTSCSACLR